MSANTAHPLPGRSAPAWGAGRFLAWIGSSLLALIALGLVLAGVLLILAHGTARDSAGFYTSDTERFSTPTYALTSEGMQIGDIQGDGAEWAIDAIDATVRVRASQPDGEPIFIGIASEQAVDRYLTQVAHEEVSDVHSGPFTYDSVRSGGGATPGAPTSASFWAATATGPGTQALTWKPDVGRWAVVVMNVDGSPRVSADVSVGAKTGILLPVGIGLLALSIFVVIGSAALIELVVREPSGPAGGATAEADASASAVADTPAVGYPLRFEARLDEPLSRWLWLIKWLLALPHWIVLAFLWIAYHVLTLIALVAILFSGSYPRPLFDFNVGVLRWTWRVVHYACALGTDRYPPFTLAAVGYPAELDVAYPERLSRSKAFFKPWLLAIPHWFVVAAFLGSWSVEAGPPGLFAVLAVIAGVVLLFTGRYPRDVFELVVGIVRWVARVVVYAGLMRDEYPPFRLDR